MLKIHKQANAENDLVDIWVYSLERWGLTQADQYVDNLEESIKTIAANPKLGTSCDYVREGYRKLHVKEHYVFYKLTLDTLHIIRVLGDEMDYQEVLESEE
jgi:toxin ParE1/3/4